MKFFASLGHGLGSWLGLPSRESLGLPTISAGLPGVEVPLPGVRDIRLVTPSVAPQASTAAAPTLPKAVVGADGLTDYQRKTRQEMKLKLAFGLGSKMIAATSGAEKEKVQLAWLEYLDGQGSTPVVKSAVVPVAKGATPAPVGVDDNGSPVKTEPTGDDDPTLADILPGLIQSLQDLIDELQEKMPDAPVEDDDGNEAKATDALARGQQFVALGFTAKRLLAVGERYQAAYIHGMPRAMADAKWFSKLKPKAEYIPNVDLPTDPHTVRPSATINEKYRVALAALDAEINACVAQSRPLSQQLLARRNSVNREWIAINRRRN